MALFVEASTKKRRASCSPSSLKLTGLSVFMKQTADERSHARLQIVRELFGLEADEADGADASVAPAEVRELPRRASDAR